MVTGVVPHVVESRVRDTWNTDILDELKPATGDVVLYKNRFSSFYQTELDAILKRKGDLVSHLHQLYHERMRGVHGSGRDVSGLLARAHRLHRRADRVWSAEK